MSSEVKLFDGGVPDYLKNVGADAMTQSLAGGGGPKRISIKGNVFRIMMGAQEIATSEERNVEVVIVDAAKHVGRSYYSGTYTEGANSSPDCWSSDGTTPDVSIETPQAPSCAVCPQNKAGSSASGDGRACRYSQKISVVMADNIEGDVYAMNLPAKSVFGAPEGDKMPLKAYARYISARNIPVSAVVTEMKFDMNSPTPKLFFKPIRGLNNEEFALVQRQKETETSQMAIGKISSKKVGAPEAEAAEEIEKEEESKPVKVKKNTASKDKSSRLDSVLSEWEEDES